jgi:AraC-like DNA-binding protein
VLSYLCFELTLQWREDRLAAEGISTDDVAPHRRLSFWRDAVCDTFVELDCQSAEKERFQGSIVNRSVGDIQFSHVRAQSQHVVRTRSKIARSSKDFFLLSIQVQGAGVISQDGRDAILKPGDFSLYDTTRPYDLRFPKGFEQLVLRLPRQIVDHRLEAAESLTAVRISGEHGIGRIASIFLQQLHRDVNDISPLLLDRIHGNAVDLMTAALVEQLGATQTSHEASVILRRRVLAFIDSHIGDPRLSCDFIARAHNISERYLRKIFETSSMSVSEWIWSRRLDQAKRDLADPALKHVAVTAIAYDLGFKDAAHFTRAFKARFSVLPSDWRKHQMLADGRLYGVEGRH